jgi:hypothetical protein
MPNMMGWSVEQMARNAAIMAKMYHHEQAYRETWWAQWQAEGSKQPDPAGIEYKWDDGTPPIRYRVVQRIKHDKVGGGRRHTMLYLVTRDDGLNYIMHNPKQFDPDNFRIKGTGLDQHSIIHCNRGGCPGILLLYTNDKDLNAHGWRKEGSGPDNGIA